MATFPIYQLYIELEDYKPKMWRRIQILSNITLARLAYVIMTLYEIRNNYSYEFMKDEEAVYLKKHPEYTRNKERFNRLNKDLNKLRYGITSKKNFYMYIDKDYGELKDATITKMKDLLSLKNDEIFFKYDPEINWKFKIVLEEIIDGKRLFVNDFPRVIDGNGYGIIEKYNGSKDLEKKRNLLKRRGWINDDKNYKNYSLIGQSDRLYMDKLNIDDMNYRLKVLPKVFQQRYEEDVIPSVNMTLILNRKYHVYRKK